MIKKLIGALLLSALMGTEALAFRVTPMRYLLEPGGSGAETTLRLENTYPVELPVEVVVFERSVTPDGKEVRRPADEDFLIFPPQSLIPVGGEQAFRVRYVGDPAITEMRSFVVMLRQLPIRDDASEESGVELMLALGTAAYVGPAGIEADLSAEGAIDGENPDKATITISNAGRAIGYIDRFTLDLRTDDGSEASISPEIFNAGAESPLIMPFGTRVFSIDLPEGLKGKTLAAVEIGAPIQ